jgi:hypothetical protein
MGAFSCTLDSSSGSVIADEETCNKFDDATSTSGQKCVWCKVPILGGSCITNSMHDSVGFMCSDTTKSKRLRGGVELNQEMEERMAAAEMKP